eukprot:4123587-Pleurochrysis_carterae.AAC.1
MEPRILNFIRASSMNDRAAAAHKAARLVHGDDEANGDPTCAHHAITNTFEEGRKAMDAFVREMMNLTDDLAATDAKNVKAMRASVGWFSLPSCALIYQCSKYVALHSSKGYAMGAKFWEAVARRGAPRQEGGVL